MKMTMMAKGAKYLMMNKIILFKGDFSLPLLVT